MDSSSSEEEDFEGFVVTPEEKLSYKAWTRKRRASEAFNDSSDDDLSGDDDNEDDDDDEEGFFLSKSCYENNYITIDQNKINSILATTGNYKFSLRSRCRKG